MHYVLQDLKGSTITNIDPQKGQDLLIHGRVVADIMVYPDCKSNTRAAMLIKNGAVFDLWKK